MKIQLTHKNLKSLKKSRVKNIGENNLGCSVKNYTFHFGKYFSEEFSNLVGKVFVNSVGNLKKSRASETTFISGEYFFKDF